MDNLESIAGKSLVKLLDQEPQLLPAGVNRDEFVNELVEDYYEHLEFNARHGMGYFENLEMARELIVKALNVRSVE